MPIYTVATSAERSAHGQPGETLTAAEVGVRDGRENPEPAQPNEKDKLLRGGR